MGIRVLLILFGVLTGFSWKYLPSEMATHVPRLDRHASQWGKNAKLGDDVLVPPLMFEPMTDPMSVNPVESDDWDSSRLKPVDAFSHDSGALFHPHGETVCASGCSLSSHPTPVLTLSRYRQLLDAYATQPMQETNVALDTLLFYGKQTRSFLWNEQPSSLEGRQFELLEGSLRKTHVQVSARIVDLEGLTRSELSPTRVPLDRRHVFTMKSDQLQPHVVSGTVKRVGLNHLWVRL